MAFVGRPRRNNEFLKTGKEYSNLTVLQEKLYRALDGTLRKGGWEPGFRISGGSRKGSNFAGEMVR